MISCCRRRRKNMKRTLISILTVVMLICAFGLSACGHNEHSYVDGRCSCGEIDFNHTQDGFTFSLINNDSEYMVEEYNGTSSDVIVPSTYDNKPVTQIGENAFNKKTSIKSVAIAKSIEYIGANAFYFCSSLEKVKFEKGSQLKEIGEYAFSGCSKLSYIQLPENIEDICDYAFRGCIKLNYTVKDGLKYLGTQTNSCFYLVERESTSITQATIDSNCKIINTYAFSGCTKLTSITIPIGVEVLHYNAFYNCQALTIYCERESMPQGWDLGWNDDNNPVVWSCSNNDVADDGYIYIMSNGLKYGVKNGEAIVAKQQSTITEANIPASITYKGNSYSVTSISDKAFYYCTSLTNVVIPNSVVQVGNSAFTGCNSLVYNDKDGIKYLGNSQNPNLYLANVTNKKIQTITLDSNCKIIGYNAFMDCVSLRNIEFSDNIASIGASAFSGCIELTNIQIPDSIMSVGEKAFFGCTLLDYNEKGGLRYLGNDTNPYLCLIEKIDANIIEPIIDENCKIITDYAFADCTKIINITIPKSVRTMGYGVFSNCISLIIYCEIESQPKYWEVGWNMLKNPVVWDCKNNSVAEDGYIYTIIDGMRYALKDGKATVVRQLENLTEANIPSTVTYKGNNYPVTSIGENAFTACVSLGIVSVPSSIESVDNTAFSNIGGITIYCEAQTRPAGWSSNWNPLNNPVIWDCNNNSLADDGNVYLSIDGINYCIKEGRATVARQVRGITKANIPATISYAGTNYSISVISEKAFYGCSSLTEVTLSASVYRIEKSAFEGCTLLQTISLSSNLVFIGERAFAKCSSVDSFIIPAQVQQIGIYAFEGCDSLTSITFEDPKNWRKTETESVWLNLEVGSGCSIGENAKNNARDLRGTYAKFYYHKYVLTSPKK